MDFAFFDKASTPFRSLFAKYGKFLFFFVYFRFSLKNLAITYHACLPHYKPNPKGIFMQCRYNDTRIFLSLKTSTPKHKPFQTETYFTPSPCEAGRRAVTLRRRKEGWGVGITSRRQGLGVRSTNQIQREFDSNGGIAPFDHEPSAPTNKPFQTETRFTPFLCEAGEGLGMGDACFALTENCLLSTDNSNKKAPSEDETIFVTLGGVEPPTKRLRVACSAIELQSHSINDYMDLRSHFKGKGAKVYRKS
jgi:hypothetical protein